MNRREISIHDNEIHSYNFCLKTKKLTLKTLFSGKQTNIEFFEVLAYSFDGVSDQNILFEIADKDIESFFRWYIEHGEVPKQLENGLPLENYVTEDLLAFLKKENYRYYEVNASVGLDGYVIAKSMLKVT